MLPPLMPDTVRRFKYLDALATAFVVVLLALNLVALKICPIGPFAIGGVILLCRNGFAAYDPESNWRVLRAQGRHEGMPYH